MFRYCFYQVEGGTPGVQGKEGEGSFNVTFKISEELTYGELEKSKEVEPEEEGLSEANKNIIPIYKGTYIG